MSTVDTNWLTPPSVFDGAAAQMQQVKDTQALPVFAADCKTPLYLCPALTFVQTGACLEAPPLRSGQAFIPSLQNHGVFGQGL